MDSILLSNISALTDVQKSSLKKGRFTTVADLVLAGPKVIADRCRITPSEANRVFDCVCKANCAPVMSLMDVKHRGDEKFTTGDGTLDSALGGGIRTGMVWEIVGESAAGKTQLALQAALFVQIDPELGGLAGSACYLTTSSKLPTTRLVQISQHHPLLSPSQCGLADIHTISTPTIPTLIKVLSEILPPFLKELAENETAKSVKLIVIDALAELFHTSGKTSTTTLVERAKNITEISTLLHTIASSRQVAVLVLNEVVDVFDRPPSDADLGNPGDLIYRDQSRWFNRADSIPGEGKKEASLGLVWANQVNARIMLTRTGRRRYLNGHDGRAVKQQKTGQPLSAGVPSTLSEDQSTLIRRLSVIFSSVSRPASLDYIVTIEGITTLPDDTFSQSLAHEPLRLETRPSNMPMATELSRPTQQIDPLDVGSAESAECMVEETSDEADVGTRNDDEWDAYWKDDDDIFNAIDLEALEKATQPQGA